MSQFSSNKQKKNFYLCQFAIFLIVSLKFTIHEKDRRVYVTHPHFFDEMNLFNKFMRHTVIQNKQSCS